MAHSSATTKPENRREFDFYPTPSSATEALLKYVDINGAVYEPCVGQGDISKVLILSKAVTNIITNDINESVKCHSHFDATDESYWLDARLKYNNASWTVTNPPFNKASEIIPLAYKYSEKGIAMLLRGSYTEPTFDRQEWLQEHEEYLSDIIYLPRISFTGDNKTDSVSTNWYVWKKEKQQGCKLHWVLKTKHKRVSKAQGLLEWMK